MVLLGQLFFEYYILSEFNRFNKMDSLSLIYMGKSLGDVVVNSYWFYRINFDH